VDLAIAPLALASWMALAFGLALVGTWLARTYALRRALIDLPGDRRSHAVPTPRGGGIAIVVAMLPLFAWLAWQAPARAPAIALVGTGLLLVAGIGWIDDHRPLSPGSRLLVHALAAVVLAWALVLLGAGAGTAACGFALALVLVNAWNFMDGIDGLVTSQALLAASGYALFAGGGLVAWVGLGLAAACAGFLPFNLPRASIFLGDVGSGALGYLVAALAGLTLLEASWQQAPVLLLPVLACGVDTGLTLGRRVLRGERWWQPHLQHAYQRWARQVGHGMVTAAFAAWTLAEVACMLVAGRSPSFVVACVVGISCMAAVAAWLRLQKSWESSAGVDA
jgi:UDP-N-acetylmuramyl pentapeptide phosphotransferase/UDP-N-acetylglucosamine-1-phosphate transferase